MGLVKQILQKTWEYTKREKKWRLWALLQALTLFLIADTASFGILKLPPSFWIFLLIFGVFNFVTVHFWLEIQKKEQTELDPALELVIKKQFWNLQFRFAIVAVIAFLIYFILKANIDAWSVSIFVSSLIILLSASVMLFVVLVRESLIRSLILTRDLWVKRTSLVVFLWLSLLALNAVCFVLAQLGESGLRQLKESFVVSYNFVTIWAIPLGVLVVGTLFLLLANVFLVLGFLELIKTLRLQVRVEPEKEVSPAFIAQ